MTASGLSKAELRRVLDFMVRCGTDVKGDLSADMLAGGRSNITYELTDGFNRWVLRRPPFGGLTQSAHDMAREHTVTSALVDSDVPVAAPVGLCADVSVIGAQFTIAEFAEGIVVRTKNDLESIVGGGVERCIEELVRTLANLHTVDIDEVGLGTFAKRTDYGGRQVRRWSAQWDAVATSSRSDATTLAAELNRRVPKAGSSAVVHGDFRIDNVILDATDASRVVAVVDWELSTLGDPVADVAQMCAYRDPALDLILGFSAAWTSTDLPTVDDLAASYEKISGRSLDHWEFFVGLAYYKLAVISEGINHRYQVGATRGEGFASAGEAVPELLSAGLRTLAGR